MAVFWRNIDKSILNPVFLADVDKFLTDSPFDWYVLEGRRSFVRSEELWKAYVAGTGPRAAPPGKSAHNFGLAIDVVLDADPDKPGLQASWNIKLAGWLWLKLASIKHPRLKNGWSFSDWPHIEKYKWEQFK